MSWTDAPPGGRPRCSVCGEHRWAYDGYCLSVECAGPLDHPRYPLSMPDELRADRDARKLGKKKPLASETKIKMPKKGTRRSTELWYESQGKVAPWLEKKDNPT